MENYSVAAGSDPHKPLRDDVRLLGELLGETLRQQVSDLSAEAAQSRGQPQRRT